MFAKLTKCPSVRNDYIPTNSASFCCQKRTTLPFGVTNEQRFPLVLQTNNAFLWCYQRTTLSFGVTKEQRFQNRYSNIFQFRPYDRFLCCQSLHGIVRNHDKVYQAYEKSVSKKRLHTKRTTLHFFCQKRTTFPFVVRNEQRFQNLHGVVGNKERFSDKNFSTLLPIYSLKSDFFSICFFGRLDFFFRPT